MIPSGPPIFVTRAFCGIIIRGMMTSSSVCGMPTAKMSHSWSLMKRNPLNEGLTYILPARYHHIPTEAVAANDAQVAIEAPSTPRPRP